MAGTAWGVAQPPTIRSTQIGGEWEFVRLDEQDVLVDARVRLMAQTLAGVQRTMVLTELGRKIEKAARGELRPDVRDEFGHVVEKGEASYTERHREVFEIRFDAKIMRDVRLHTRIYFTEPDVFPDQLLMLAIEWKHDDPIGKTEQDSHIDLAHRRGECHCG